MARLFSFASWNIENFYGRENRFDRVVDTLLENGPPDVFGIFEVRSSTTVFTEFTRRMPTHQFFITVTPHSPIDTLIGVSREFTAFYEQRNELTSKMPSLRPGALVTLTIDNTDYSLLFVHLKAMDAPIAWGLRDDMVHHIRNLKKRLDSVANASSNLIALGDYNSVGLNVTFADNDMTGTEELVRYEKVFKSKKMVLIPKDQPHTLWNGPDSQYPPIDADHVFASKHLDIRRNNTTPGIRVAGWPEFNTQAEQGQWISELSDHAMIYGEVHNGGDNQ